MAQNNTQRRLQEFQQIYHNITNFYLENGNQKYLQIYLTTTKIDESDEKISITITKINKNDIEETIYQNELISKTYFISILINSIRYNFINDFWVSKSEIITNKDNTHTQIISCSYASLTIELSDEEKLANAKETILPQRKNKIKKSTK